MKTIKSFRKIIELSQMSERNGNQIFVRWSRGPVLDKKQGASLDYSNHQRHNGLSAQVVRHDDPELLAQMLPEYKFHRRKDAKIYCWLFIGEQNGTDSDGAPTVDAESIKPVGKISEKLIELCSDYTWAYRDYSQKYSYNPNASQKAKDRNARLQAELDDAWNKLNS